MQVVVATHGHCFDGLASAALFVRFFAAIRDPHATFTYRACGYGAKPPRPEGHLVGDENAVLDYRYTQDPGLSWFFDHHRTAFPAAGDLASFAARSAGGQMFHDPLASSCAQLLATVAEERFGFRAPELDELVAWADRVDAARFDSPQAATDRTNPVMRLVTVVEHHGDAAFLARTTPLLLERPLAEVASSPEITERYGPLGARHEHAIERIRAVAERVGRVVFVDLTQAVPEGLTKFATYALFPDSVYSVAVRLRRTDVTVSVGYNPWSGAVRDADISAICARHGGGGHAVVGAVYFSRREIARARDVARSIAVELAG